MMTANSNYEEYSHFWNKMAKKYSARPIDDMPAYEAKMERVQARLSAEDRVLEVGCGTGGTAIRLAPNIKQWTASDFSAEMIKIAQSKAAPDNVNFVVADSETVLDGGPFDVVCAFNVLHLVPAIDASLANIHRQLKPGGLFISNSPCLGDKNLFVRLMVRVTQRFYGIKALHIFRSEAIIERIKASGFEIIENRYLSKKAMGPYLVAQKV